jgi:hypothetical protein
MSASWDCITDSAAFGSAQRGESGVVLTTKPSIDLQSMRQVSHQRSGTDGALGPSIPEPCDRIHESQRVAD